MIDELLQYYISEIWKKPKKRQNMTPLEIIALSCICIGLIAYLIFLFLDMAMAEVIIILIMFVAIITLAIAEKVYTTKSKRIKTQKINHINRINKLKKYLKRKHLYKEKIIDYLIEECEKQLDEKNKGEENIFELIKQLVTYIPTLTIGILETWITNEITVNLTLNQEIKIVIITMVSIRLLMLSFNFAVQNIKNLHDRKWRYLKDDLRYIRAMLRDKDELDKKV